MSQGDDSGTVAALDPQTQIMLRRLYDEPFLDPVNMTAPQMRAAFDAFYARVGLPPSPVGTTDASLAVSGGSVGLRVYHPAPGGSERSPVIVFYLGGGLVMGSLDSYDSVCRRLCAASRCLVVSVAYRQPPEHPFPAAVDDSYAALLWAHAHAKDFGGDPSQLAVAGESGGGMLAAVMTHMALDRAGPAIDFQLLMYPAVGGARNTPSMRDFAEGYWFTPEQLDWLYEIYAGESDPNDPQISPACRKDLAGLPTAYVLAAEYDILRDQVLAYAAALQAAGVPVATRIYPSIHGFICMGGVIDMAGQALDGAGAAVAQHFARRRP